MYFPENMTFDYLFFSTYLGYFLQALPVALAVSAGYGLVRFRLRKKKLPTAKQVFSCLFVCYLTGLVCLTLCQKMLGNLWYWMIYQHDPGDRVLFFSGTFDFVPDFFRHLTDEEVIGNLLLFVPFGILYPLSLEKPSWKRTVLAGFLTVMAIELLQPVFGRSFDLNDVILNTLGVVAAASLFFLCKRLFRKHRGEPAPESKTP